MDRNPHVYVRAEQGIDRRSAVALVESHLPALLGRPVRVAAAPSAEDPLVDLFACDEAGTLFAVCWVGEREMERELLALLVACAGIQARAGEIMARIFSAQGRRASFRLVLVGPRVEPHWLALAGALAFPISLVRVNPVRGVGEEAGGVYFECIEAESAAAANGAPRRHSARGPQENSSDSQAVFARFVEPMPEPMEGSGRSLRPIEIAAPAGLYEGLSPEEAEPFRILEGLLARSGRAR